MKDEDMATKILRVTRIFTTPKPLVGAPPSLSGIKRPNQRAAWSCDVCKKEHPKTVRWYMFRKHFAKAASGSTVKRKARICPECAAKMYTCAACGSLRMRGVAAQKPQMVLMKQGSKAATEHAICPACHTKLFYRCAGCGGHYLGPADYTRGTEGADKYCSRCAANFKPCDECKGRFAPTELLELNKYRLCKTCHTAYTPVTGGHGNKPAPHFYTLHTETTYLTTPRLGELYMGVELEIDDGRRAAKLCGALDTFQHLYLKRDGSLSEIGIEVVTHPGTLEAHKELFKWDSVLKICRNHEYEADKAKRSCGLHVHVNRSFLDRRYADPKALASAKDTAVSMNLMKLMCFVYGHSKYYATLAQRTNEQYAAFGKITKATDLRPGTSLRENVLLKYKKDVHRYQALNYSNAHTVEWRIFKGTLNHDTLMATLELVDATCNYIKSGGVSRLLRKDESWKEFCEYVEANDRYQYLKAYMQTRGVWA